MHQKLLRGASKNTLKKLHARAPKVKFVTLSYVVFIQIKHFSSFCFLVLPTHMSVARAVSQATSLKRPYVILYLEQGDVKLKLVYYREPDSPLK